MIDLRIRDPVWGQWNFRVEQKLADEMEGDWGVMDDFPKTGVKCDVLVALGEGISIAREIWWGREPIGKDFCLRGSNNPLSPVLHPIGWRLHKPLNMVPIGKDEKPDFVSVGM